VNDDQLRQAYARQLAKRATGAREGCASPEALLALVERRGSEMERLATLDHAMGCETCRLDLELLRAVNRAGEGRLAASVRSIRPRQILALASPRRLAAAAVLVIAVGALATATLRRGREAGWRGPAKLALVSPKGAIPSSEGLSLVWRRAAGAVRYEVELLTAAGDSVFATATADTVLTLPPAATLLPGSDYVWSVRSVLGDGTQAASAPLRFRIQP